MRWDCLYLYAYTQTCIHVMQAMTAEGLCEFQVHIAVRNIPHHLASPHLTSPHLTSTPPLAGLYGLKVSTGRMPDTTGVQSTVGVLGPMATNPRFVSLRTTHIIAHLLLHSRSAILR